MKKKENKSNKWLTSSLSVLLVAGMVACTGENTTGVDTVEEGVIETEEVTAETWDNESFGTNFASNNRFGEWDENDDTFLDENEYADGFFDTWDLNDDDMLDENEWNTGSSDFGLENETWADWDTSGDGMLDENEYRTGFGDNEWRSNWDVDKDGMLTEREYSDGIFGLWDDNEDGTLDNNEYGAYNTYYND